MTIRLLDVDAQRRYRDEVETYERRSRERAEKGEWSLDLGPYPKPPEPMVDSRDREASATGINPFALGGFSTGLRDGGPSSPDPLDRDGTSSEAPEGWESGWQEKTEGVHRTTAPFKAKKE